MSNSEQHHSASMHDGQLPEHDEQAAHNMAQHAQDDMHRMHEHHGAHDMAQPAPYDDMPTTDEEHGIGGAHGHAEHADHTGHERMFRTRFWVSLLLSVPVLVFGLALPQWLGFGMPVFPGVSWIPFIFSLIVFAYGGIPFLQMAVPEVRNREPGMMTLISLAISVAFFYSVAAQLFGLGEGFFRELVTLIDIMLLGHWLEMRSVRQASGAMNGLARLMPDTAERLAADGSSETIAADMLRRDDMVLVRPGGGIPADGQVVEDNQA